MVITILICGMIIFAAIFAVYLGRDMVKHKDTFSDKSVLGLAASSGIPLFFDALGIGSYAPQTTIYKLTHLIPDRLIPGSLSVMCSLPCAISCILYITVIDVDPITLFSTVAASALGAAIGARFVARLPEKKIQLGMGIALIVVALVMIIRQLGLMPPGGEATGLVGWRLVAAIVGCFIIGAVMTIGIGNYGPTMALTYSLGMSPACAFPIMMASGAYLMTAAGFTFVKEGAYDRKACLVGVIAGAIGIIIAVVFVKSLPLTVLTWIVIVAIFYASIMMLRSAFAKEKPVSEEI
ncbi:MAG TPA: sulfite exporter TauE/SafE family protein [Firmicutes bacterium]|nr:sulfite exporter TauE/SafE family protein [Bacillota bacterium]